MDVLTDLLDRSHARGGAFGRTVLAEPWGVTFDLGLPLAVHAVLGGEAHVVTGASSVRLLAGDIALVRGPDASTLDSCQHPRRLSLADALRRFNPTGRELVFPGPPAGELVCGAYSFDGDLCAPLLTSLPPIVHLRAGPETAPLRPLIAGLVDELARDQPGQQVVLDRYLDLLLVQALRTHFTRSDVDRPSWYVGLLDVPVGTALRAIHARPADPWTVELLAREARLSRAAFARRFNEIVGQPPQSYLTSWRIQLARERLRDPQASITAIADEVGYANQYAFAAAFKREVGEPPGRWRRRHSTSR
jgi:AraC-like DNA-binding protein